MSLVWLIIHRVELLIDWLGLFGWSTDWSEDWLVTQPLGVNNNAGTDQTKLIIITKINKQTQKV